LDTHQAEILTQWLSLQAGSMSRQQSASEGRNRESLSREFLTLLRNAISADSNGDLNSPAWAPVREFVNQLSTTWAKGGFSPTETASFVLSLKEPLFTKLRAEVQDPQKLGEEIWSATVIVDRLALATTEAYLKTREKLIARQQQELLDLSTPVVRLWDGVLALPLIGTLDSARTQVVMQNLLEALVETRSDIAIIDITGVPTVDTLVAQHLLKTVAAARLMGADCIISGIRPQIAQTIIHLGVDLSAVVTKATMADAFRLALQRLGQSFGDHRPQHANTAQQE
jgi:rsbT co-antagonist protein RsbR